MSDLQPGNGPAYECSCCHKSFRDEPQRFDGATVCEQCQFILIENFLAGLRGLADLPLR